MNSRRLYVLLRGLRDESLRLLVSNDDDCEEPLLALARRLARDAGWTRVPDARLVVRLSPSPCLGVLARVDANAETRLSALSWQLRHASESLRYVGYEQAQSDCEILADKMRREFGSEEIRSFAFTAIPRGGMIVLGMLAYVLGIPVERLNSGCQSRGAPCVVVDDCALTGTRFRSFLHQLESSRIVFATLYSPLELRTAMLAREECLLKCLSAHDLVDHAPRRLKRNYSEWRENWLDRSQCAYWVGQPDYVAFAWNEPTITYWDPENQAEVEGWRILPSAMCLKNRDHEARQPVPVQIQAVGKGFLKPSADVLFVDSDEQITVAHLSSEECFRLTDASAEIWRLMFHARNLHDLVEGITNLYDIDSATAARDVEAFIRDVIAKGLVVDAQHDEHAENRLY